MIRSCFLNGPVHGNNMFVRRPDSSPNTTNQWNVFGHDSMSSIAHPYDILSYSVEWVRYVQVALAIVLENHLIPRLPLHSVVDPVLDLNFDSRFGFCFEVFCKWWWPRKIFADKTIRKKIVQITEAAIKIGEKKRRKWEKRKKKRNLSINIYCFYFKVQQQKHIL